MEPFQVLGAAEESHSSESGWTMYIGSPFYGDDDDGNNEDDASGGDDDDKGGKGCNNHKDDSDDSMVSDASSWPSHQGNANLKHEDFKEENGEVHWERKEAGKPIEKQKVGDMRKRRRRRKEEKKHQESVAMAEGGNNASAHQSGSIKVRKILWSGKKK